MKSLNRNVAIAMFFAFVVGSIYGCAEKPITFAGPGVQIWKLDIIHEDGSVIKDVTLLLKPSATEKDVFHVTGTVDGEAKSENWGKYHVFAEWKGEIRNGMMLCEVSWNSSGSINTELSGTGTSIAKGTFSKRRASGTIHVKTDSGSKQGKWTAERIS